MKQNRHSLMAKGIMVLLSLLILVFAITHAWFSPPVVDVTASGIQAGVQSPSITFDISVGFSNSQTGYQYYCTEFAKSVDLRDMRIGEVPYDLLKNYSPKDMTGNGASLYVPSLVTNNYRRAINTNTTMGFAVLDFKSNFNISKIFSLVFLLNSSIAVWIFQKENMF